MKSKILTWLQTTQKATGALVGAAGAVASATFIPAPWGQYAAIAAVVGTWLLTYVLPYVSQAVEAFPEKSLNGIPASDWGGWDHTAEYAIRFEHVDEPEPAPVLEGEVFEPDPYPDTVEIMAVIPDDTAGIPLIEDGEPDVTATDEYEHVPFDEAVTVGELLERLKTESQLV